MDSIDVLAHKESGHIRGFEPYRFGRSVPDKRSIDLEILEGHILDHSGVVVTRNDREIGMAPPVGDVSEEDVFDPSSR